MFEVKRHTAIKSKTEKLIAELIQLNIKQSIKLANTLINWKQEIINILKYKINNGYVEVFLHNLYRQRTIKKLERDLYTTKNNHL